MRVARALVGLILVGTATAALASFVEVESILTSGPLLSLCGLTLGFMSFRARQPRAFFYALAGPTIFVACAALIAGMHWSPREAQAPVVVILLASAALHAATIRPVLRDLRFASGPKAKAQFSFLWMLVIVTLAAIAMAAVGHRDGELSIVLAAVAYAACLLFVARRLRNELREQHP